MNHELHDPACTGTCFCVGSDTMRGRCYRCGLPDVDPTKECFPPYIRRAAVSMIKREDKYVVVWNTRYHGWTFPGGLVEERERCVDARDREVREEVGLTVTSGRLLFIGRHGIRPASADRGGRAGIVYLYEVEAYGEAKMMEPGCPVSALTREDFLKQSPYAPFYEHVFGALEERARIVRDLRVMQTNDDRGSSMLTVTATRFEQGGHVKEYFPS